MNILLENSRTHYSKKSQIFFHDIYLFYLVKSKSKAASNLWADTDEEDNAENETDDYKDGNEQKESQKNFTILAVESHVYEDPDTFPMLQNILERNEFKILQVKDAILTEDDIKFLTSGVKMSEEQMDEIVQKLLEVNCKLLMLRAEEGEKVSGIFSSNCAYIYTYIYTNNFVFLMIIHD